MIPCCRALDSLNDSRGFTLIEFAVVLLIIGILASIAIPKYVDMTQEVKETKMRMTFQYMISVAALCRAEAIIAGADINAADPVSIMYSNTPVTLVYGLPSGIDMKTLLGGLEGYYTEVTATTLLIYPEPGDASSRVFYRQVPVEPIWLFANGTWEQKY